MAEAPKLIVPPDDVKLSLSHELTRLAALFPDVALVVFTADSPPMDFDELKAFLEHAIERHIVASALKDADAEGKLA